MLAKPRSELLLEALLPQLRSGTAYSVAFGLLMPLVAAPTKEASNIETVLGCEDKNIQIGKKMRGTSCTSQ